MAKVSAQELLLTEPKSSEHDPWWWASGQLVPEIVGSFQADTSQRVRTDVLERHDIDFHRRFWRLLVIRLDGDAVMLVQEAGREGDDHRKRFILNEGLYRELAQHLVTLLEHTDSEKVALLDPEQVRDDLDEFYGYTLSGAVEDPASVNC